MQRPRDGTGPVRAAFTTMLLLEDTIAINLGAHRVCSGDATVTVYRFINLEGVSAETIGLALTDYVHLQLHCWRGAASACPGHGAMTIMRYRN